MNNLFLIARWNKRTNAQDGRFHGLALGCAYKQLYFSIETLPSASTFVLFISLYSFASVPHNKIPKSDISMSRHTAVICSNTFEDFQIPPNTQ